MRLIPLLASLVCCTSGSNTLGRHPDAEECAASPHPELAALCWLAVGTRAASRGQARQAEEACGAVEPELWRDECFFQAAEEVSMAGDLPVGLSFCGRAGFHRGACQLHLAWWARPTSLLEDEGPTPDRVEAALARIRPSLAALPPAEQAPAEALWATALWFDALYGSGRVDPATLEALPAVHGGPARTAFAFEAVRLARAAGDEPLATVAALMEGRAPLEGRALPRRCQGGLTSSPPGPDQRRPTTPVVHGGERLLAEDPGEDLIIASLEALAFHGGATPAALGAWREDPRPAPRATAARLLRLAGEDPGRLPEDPPWLDTWALGADPVEWYRSGDRGSLLCPG